MALDTFADLVAETVDWLDRPDLEAKIPTLVALAERTLERRLDLSSNESEVCLPLVSGMTPLPDDYAAWRSLSGPCGEPIHYVAPHAFQALYHGRRPGGLLAAAFTIVGSVPLDDVDGSFEAWVPSLSNAFLRVAPAPGGPVRLVYRQGVSPLGERRPTNWLLAKAPDLYLLATLCEAERFLKNDSRVAVWKSDLAEKVEDLRTLDRSARWGRARMVMTEPTP